MPDWTQKEYSELITFIDSYTRSLNSPDFTILGTLFSNDAVLHRAMKNHTGRNSIVDWFKRTLESGQYRFKLADASAALLPDETARCILWYEISDKNNDVNQKAIHIETLELIRQDGAWKIKTCFGLGFDPERHEASFRDM